MLMGAAHWSDRGHLNSTDDGIPPLKVLSHLFWEAAWASRFIKHPRMLSCATKVRTIGLGRELRECEGVEANSIESGLANKYPISPASPQY